MLSQAEHDPLAAAILVTTSAALAEKVGERLEYHLKKLPREEIARRSIETNSAIFVTDTLENAVAISNNIAPEHLEVCVEEPFALLPLIKHAGSIFLGHNAPEALGDYFAGPNHTLPTSGTARFSSPLSVDDYIKKSSFIYYDREALRCVHKEVEFFARREGLDAHGDSVSIRFEE
jgi:histidinol dehydrogenase